MRALGSRLQHHVERLQIPAPRIIQITNWADGQAIKPVPPAKNALRTAWGLQGAFVISHSGNLGRPHDGAPLLQAVGTLERTPAKGDEAFAPGTFGHAAPEAATGRSCGPPAIRWLFIGGGSEFAAVEQACHEKRFTSAVFKTYQPRARLAESLSCADAHLVTLRPEFEGLIGPNKVDGCMAAGRPILFVGARDGEVAQLITKHACGWVIPPDDPEGLARAILALAADPVLVAELGRNARRAFDDHFDLRHAEHRWRELIQALAAQPQAVVASELPPEATGSLREVDVGHR